MYYLGEEGGLEIKENEVEPQGGEQVEGEIQNEGDEEDTYLQEGECEISSNVIRREMISKDLVDLRKKGEFFSYQMRY